MTYLQRKPDVIVCCSSDTADRWKKPQKTIYFLGLYRFVVHIFPSFEILYPSVDITKGINILTQATDDLPKAPVWQCSETFFSKVYSLPLIFYAFMVQQTWVLKMKLSICSVSF